MGEAIEYVSCLVRIWWGPQDGETEAAPAWTAEVESIQTGKTRRFSEMAELAQFFQELMSDPDNYQA